MTSDQNSNLIYEYINKGSCVTETAFRHWACVWTITWSRLLCRFFCKLYFHNNACKKQHFLPNIVTLQHNHWI